MFTRCFATGFAAKLPPKPAGKIQLPNISKIIAVASGKGGVGKSTTAGSLEIAASIIHLHSSMLVYLQLWLQNIDLLRIASVGNFTVNYRYLES